MGASAVGNQMEAIGDPSFESKMDQKELEAVRRQAADAP